MNFILYSTAGCHLCDKALAVASPLLLQAGFPLQVVDIADSDTLFERYALRIPVLLSPDGRELGWPFSAGQIEQLLQRE